MKKILIQTLLALATVTACLAQIDTPPVPPPSPLGEPVDKVLGFLSQGSNFIIAPYGIWDSGKSRGGAGIGIGYHLSDFVVPNLRLDWLDHQLYMPSGSMQVQLPIYLKKDGSFKLTPFVLTGIATPLGGKQNDNGAAVGIFGIGTSLQISKRFGLIYDIEKWSGFAGNQHRFGFHYRF